MKKMLMVLALAVFMLSAGLAQAQQNMALDQVVVQLWPEYDRADMLVIYDFVLAGSGEQAQTVALQIPENAELIAVARDMDGSLVVEVYDAALQDGWQVVTLHVLPGVVYHIEYYDALDRRGKTRSYTYTWQGTLPVNRLSVSVLPPPNASQWQFSPSLTMSLADDGATPLYKGDFGPFSTGEVFSLDVSYQKADDSLAVNKDQTETPEVPLSFSERVQANLPYLLGGTGLLMLLAGGWLYRSMQKDAQKRPSAGRKAKKAGKPGKADVRYCPQCGRRAEAGDRFCRACGTRLRD